MIFFSFFFFSRGEREGKMIFLLTFLYSLKQVPSWQFAEWDNSNSIITMRLFFSSVIFLLFQVMLCIILNFLSLINLEIVHTIHWAGQFQHNLRTSDPCEFLSFFFQIILMLSIHYPFRIIASNSISGTIPSQFEFSPLTRLYEIFNSFQPFFVKITNPLLLRTETQATIYWVEQLINMNGFVHLKYLI